MNAQCGACRSETVSVLNQTSSHEEVSVSGGIAPRILNFDIRWRLVGGQIYAPDAVTPGRETLVTSGRTPEPRFTGRSAISLVTTETGPSRHPEKV
jgi:hypothetical protein